MARYTVEEIEVKKDWENFVLSHQPQSFLQSWNWGEANKLVGNKIFRLGLFKDKKLVGVSLIIKETARRGSYFLIPGGPLLDWKNKAVIGLFLRQIRNLARKENVWFIRVRPELLDKPENRRLFSNLGFIPAPMHLHAENTWVLEIDKPEEEILAGMRKNTRYSVRKSLKQGLVVKISDELVDSHILWKLQEETVKRHRFVGFPKQLFEAQLESFGQDNQARLFLIKRGEENLVAAIIIFYGNTAYYHHSASGEKARELSASYFLQWRVIQEAKKRGCRHYNFWGIAPTDNPKHRFAGVTLFKKGFGGERVDWLHAQDLPLSPFYWLTYLFETGRRVMRRL